MVVTPANNRRKSFGWFGWTGTTNYNLEHSKNRYNARRNSGEELTQPSDPKWYLDDLREYDLEDAYQRYVEAREFEEEFYSYYFSALTLPFGGANVNALKSPRLYAFLVKMLGKNSAKGGQFFIYSYNLRCTEPKT